MAAGHDAFKGGAIIANDVLVKSTPSAVSATVATLSYNMVELADWEVDGPRRSLEAEMV